MSKVLVSYFSASGVTKRVAEKVSTAINGDLFEIEPVEKYTDADLDWTDKQSRSSIEMNNNIKPEVLNKVSNLDQYDTICLAFPIWWYKAPTIVNTFFEGAEWKGKQVALFATSGSSGIDGAWESLKASAPGAVLVAAKRFSSTAFQDEVDTWVKTM